MSNNYIYNAKQKNNLNTGNIRSHGKILISGLTDEFKYGVTILWLILQMKQGGLVISNTSMICNLFGKLFQEELRTKCHAA